MRNQTESSQSSIKRPTKREQWVSSKVEQLNSKPDRLVVFNNGSYQVAETPTGQVVPISQNLKSSFRQQSPDMKGKRGSLVVRINPDSFNPKLKSLGGIFRVAKTPQSIMRSNQSQNKQHGEIKLNDTRNESARAQSFINKQVVLRDQFDLYKAQNPEWRNNNRQLWLKPDEPFVVQKKVPTDYNSNARAKTTQPSRRRIRKNGFIPSVISEPYTGEKELPQPHKNAGRLVLGQKESKIAMQERVMERKKQSQVVSSNCCVIANNLQEFNKFQPEEAPRFSTYGKNDMIWSRRVTTADTLRSKRHILDAKMLRSTDSDDGNDKIGTMKASIEEGDDLDDDPLEKVKIFLKKNAGFDAIEEESHRKKKKKKGPKKALMTDTKPSAGKPLNFNFHGSNALGSAFGKNGMAPNMNSGIPTMPASPKAGRKQNQFSSFDHHRMSVQPARGASNPTSTMDSYGTDTNVARPGSAIINRPIKKPQVLEENNIHRLVGALYDLKGKSYVDARLLQVNAKQQKTSNLLSRQPSSLNDLQMSTNHSPNNKSYLDGLNPTTPQVKQQVELTDQILLAHMDKKKTYHNSIMGEINPRNIYKGLKEKAISQAKKTQQLRLDHSSIVFHSPKANPNQQKSKVLKRSKVNENKRVSDIVSDTGNEHKGKIKRIVNSFFDRKSTQASSFRVPKGGKYENSRDSNSPTSNARRGGSPLKYHTNFFTYENLDAMKQDSFGGQSDDNWSAGGGVSDY